MPTTSVRACVVRDEWCAAARPSGAGALRRAPRRAARALAVIAVAASFGARAVSAVTPGELQVLRATLAPSRPDQDGAGGDVLIAAVFADGFAPGDADEAVQLWNVGAGAADIAGWSIGDGEGTAAFAAGAVLPPGAWTWLGRDAEAFARTFGRPLDWAWSRGAGAARVLATTGGGPALANAGDEVVLRDAAGAPVDAIVFADGVAPASGWAGPSVRPYRTPSIGAGGQVLYRKVGPPDGLPVPDSDRASDWASDTADASLGRRARHPGWSVETRWRPAIAAGRGRVEIAVAPDALFAFLREHLAAATRSLDMAVYTFENADLAEVVAARARAGVRVRLLLDGTPVGGVSLQERWCARTIADAGGEVWYLDDGGDVRARFRSMHAKVMLVDDRLALIGSENPGPGATPSDDLADGTAGRRGLYLATDVPAVASWLRDVLRDDIDPTRRVDIRPYQERDPRRGAPPADFIPARGGGGSGYRPTMGEPFVAEGEVALECLLAPENVLTPGSGLLGLLAQAGEGDVVRVEQLAEPIWWGDGPLQGDAARNPRIDAYLAAARRGARVRVLLDGHFDDAAGWNSNAAAVRALNATARRERLDLAARLANPTGLGLHNKMVLVELDGPKPRRWLHLGSLNGTEVASKINREVAVQLAEPKLHDALARMFELDWATTNALYVPAARR